MLKKLTFVLLLCLFSVHAAERPLLIECGRSGTYHISETTARFPFPKEEEAFERPLLIIGCGRSGTYYISDLLTAAGFPLPHEELGPNGSVSWYRAGGKYYTYCGSIIKAGKEQFTHIFHQVRDPIKTIASAQTLHLQSWKYISQIIPEISLNDPLIERCAKYWYYWNILSEEMAEWTYRIEDIEEVFDEIGERIGVKLNRTALITCAKNNNSREGKYEPLTWKKLKRNIDPDLYEKIIELAEHYGYTTP